MRGYSLQWRIITDSRCALLTLLTTTHAVKVIVMPTTVSGIAHFVPLTIINSNKLKYNVVINNNLAQDEVILVTLLIFFLRCDL